MIGLLGQFAAAWLLWRGRRREAQLLYFSKAVVALVFGIADVVSMSCQCWGPYQGRHILPNSIPPMEMDGYTLQYMILVAMSYAYHGTMDIGMAVLPQWTFFFIVYVHGTGHFLSAIVALSDGMRDPMLAFYIIINSVFASFTYGLGVFLATRRRFALRDAQRLIDVDRDRYDRQWSALLASDGFRQDQREQQEAWDDIMRQAVQVPKQQLSATDIGDLFKQADRLNDRFQRKMSEIAQKHGGAFYFCEVKTETRALQKMHRAYRGDWKSLCDLVRTSIVFGTLRALTACMKDIASDPELRLLFVRHDKMRLSETYDAKESGGYRDVQLSVMVDTEETRALGVHEHRAEVQLHLRDTIALKTEGGHANYVLSRNLRGI
jgi:hypothetical protein